MRPCITCGTPANGSYCPAHQPNRGTTTARGYGYAFQKATATAIAHEPWCHNPNGCPHPDAGTPRNPLTGGHRIAVADGGTEADGIVPLCRRCNSSLGRRPL